MQIAIVDNNSVVRIGHYKNLFPNTAFPSTGPSDSFLTENNAKRVTVSLPFDRQTEKLAPTAPYIEGDNVFTVRVEALSADETAGQVSSQWGRVRRDRDTRIAATDWRVLPDVPGDQTGWREYRQALRDITEQSDPYNIVWPRDPDYVEPPQPEQEEQPEPQAVTTTETQPAAVESEPETATATTTATASS